MRPQFTFKSHLEFDMGPEEVIVTGSIDGDGKPVIVLVHDVLDERNLDCTAEQIKLLRSEYILRVLAKCGGQ